MSEPTQPPSTHHKRGRDLCTPERSERGRQENSLNAPRQRRGPGAPPGNANALKHGFYSPRFRSTELRDLDTFPANNLQDEILMLRVFIRRVIDRSDEMENPNDYISMLRAISMATRSITALLRAHQLLGGDANELSALLSQAITEVNEELRASDTSPAESFQSFPGI